MNIIITKYVFVKNLVNEKILITSDVTERVELCNPTV